MQRPKRIVIFGVLSLIVGGFILFNNLQQLSAAIGGPDTIDVQAAGQLPGQMGQLARDSLLAQQVALGEPVYRAGLGLKSLASAAMAGLLVAVGIGLLRNQPWSLRLAKIWAIFAIASALFITILQAVYLLPNIPITQANAGSGAGQYVGIGFIFIVLCIFPILLLRVLPSKPVIAYLKQEQNAHPSANTAQAMTPLDQPPANQPTTSPQDAQSTWRDDPWNDNKSQ